MNWDLAEPVDEVLRRAAKDRLAPSPETVLMERGQIESILPHRDPFLMVDQVTCLDHQARLISGRYDLNRASAVFAGHFPGRPVWPGVLQIEAIGQAGLLLCLTLPVAPKSPEPLLTHVLGALFVRPVTPGGYVDIAAHVVDDGLYTIVLGQCLQRGEICSAACLKITV